MSSVKIHEQQKEWAIKAAFGVTALILGYSLMVQPLFQDSLAMQQSLIDAQKRVELYREVQGLKKGLDDKESVLATLTERSQLLGRISDIGAKTQVRIRTLTPRTEPSGGYIKLRIDVDGQGSYFSLLKFLQAIEKIGAAIKVRDVSTLWNPVPGSKEARNTLQLQLVFETLLKQRIKKNNG